MVVPDATRRIPCALLERTLELLGPARTFVRVANGTHRRSTPAEHRGILGRHSGAVETGDRSADDASAHRAVGDFALDARALGADLLVVMGPLSFHYLAGFGGGGKLLRARLGRPGTAECVHSACLAPGGDRHPNARASLLESNPLRERVEQVCATAPRQFHLLLLLDSKGRVIEVVAGERIPAHQAAWAGAYCVPASRHEVVVVSAGGAPFDSDFVQAHKALEAATAAVRPCGTIVLLARCAEGLPRRHRDFLARHPTAAYMERALRERFDIAGHTVWAAREKAERLHIVLVGEMDRSLVQALGMEPAASLAQALAGIDPSRVALLPFGARFLPMARD